MRRIILVYGVLLTVLMTTAEYNLKCPHSGQWDKRAKEKCRIKDWYVCLWDDYEEHYAENCKKSRPQRRGRRLVLNSGNLDRTLCSNNFYQPFVFTTYKNKGCVYQKSLCSEEGQVLLSLRSAIDDTACRCDYTKGYAHVANITNPCYCIPSLEDCSCYRKQCAANKTLSPEYKCVDQKTFFPENHVCSLINDKEDDFIEIPLRTIDSKTEIQKQTALWSKITSTTVIIVVLVIIIIFGYFVIITRNKKSEEYEELKDPKDELEEKLHEHVHKLTVDIQEGKQEMTEHVEKVTSDMQEEIQELKKEVQNLEDEQCKHIPSNIQEQFKDRIEQWIKADKKFVYTPALDYILTQLNTFKSVSIVGNPGMGKTFLARHVAIEMIQKGYDLIPVSRPDDLRTFFKKETKQLFLVDDVCGRYTLDDGSLKDWKDMKEHIKQTIFANDTCKILSTCRLQVFQDSRFKELASLFKISICDIRNSDLQISTENKKEMAKIYFPDEYEEIVDIVDEHEFFPFLCDIYHKQTHGNLRKFLQNPDTIIKYELDNLEASKDKHGQLKYCCLALCTLFNNTLMENTLTAENSVIANCLPKLLDECQLDKSTPVKTMRITLEELKDTYVINDNGTYKIRHDKLFDIFGQYYGEKMLSIFISHAESGFITERFCLERKNENKFSILLPENQMSTYIERMIADWRKGKVWCVFNNTNIREESHIFRKRFISNVKSLSSSDQTELANQTDLKRHQTALFQCCFIGDTCITQWILQQNVDVNLCRDDGASPLMIASQEGFIDIVRMLVHNNVDIDTCNKDGVTALYIACRKGHNEIAELLIKHEADINKSLNTGFTPLHMSCQQGHIAIVKVLLNNNVEIDACDEDGETPLYTACHDGHSEIAELLLKHEADINKGYNNGATPLFIACQNGHTGTLELLIKHKADINKSLNNGFTPLHMSCQEGHIEIVKILLNNNVEINTCDDNRVTSLYTACQNGHNEIAELLLKHEADINKGNNNGATPLCISCQTGHTGTLELLIKYKADINKSMNDGCTPLHVSCQEGHIEIVKVLLNNNVDIDTCDDDGETPLYTVCKNGLVEIAELLIKHKVDINKGNNNGATPLFIACQAGNGNIVDVLVKGGAEIDRANDTGATPLFIACMGGRKEVVHIMLNHGADVQLSSKYGGTPLDIALENGYTDIEHMLKEHQSIQDNGQKSSVQTTNKEDIEN